MPKIRSKLLDSKIGIAILQAVAITAFRNSCTIREIAEILGYSKSHVHRWIKDARDNAARNVKVELVCPPDAYLGKCNHGREFRAGPRKICIRCMLSNFEKSPLLKIHPSEMPAQERKAYRRGGLKGGVGA